MARTSEGNFKHLQNELFNIHLLFLAENRNYLMNASDI